MYSTCTYRRIHVHASCIFQDKNRNVGGYMHSCTIHVILWKHGRLEEDRMNIGNNLRKDRERR